ncbi:MAG: hypothetical protein AB7O48_18345 [Cyclobacteriaceae bacterium]
MSSNDLTEFTYDEALYKINSPVTVVLATPWKELKPEEVELLSKILAAVRQSLASVKVVHTKALDLSQWSEKPAHLLGFGIEMPGVAKYDPITTPETRMVLADSLTVLQHDDDLKKKLWLTLKQLFFSTP